MAEMDKVNTDDIDVNEQLMKDVETDVSTKPELYMINKFKPQGLVADTMPTIKCMKTVGYFIFNYYDESEGPSLIARKAYAFIHAAILLTQYILMIINLIQFNEEVNELTANTVTVMFFFSAFLKFYYFAVMHKAFYRTWAIWHSPNSHPLFAESDARSHAAAVAKIRSSLNFVLGAVSISVVCWTVITFFGESTAFIVDAATNDTLTQEVPRLPIKAYYPFDVFGGVSRILVFIFQVYWITFMLCQGNLSDQVFCSWLIFTCEQLQHLKSIMKPLMELSSVLDTYRPDSADLFKIAGSESEKVEEETIKNTEALDMDFRAVYSNRQDFGMNFRGPMPLQTFGSGGENTNNNPNGLTKKQEMLVRSAIKYWVERHKHIVRLVTAIGDTYGVALLFHMLFATISLTLLAYQATKIKGFDVYGMCTLGYIVSTLGQVFHFCIYGNQLIEESSSVMEAAYSCNWYNGSEEAKTFVQIVCQQCQRAMSISGAKFFTVSLDLFASVLGAMVTYFMVLVQLS